MGHGPPARGVGTDGTLMLYALTVLYMILIYVRPAEIVSSWATIPFVQIVAGIAALVGLFSMSAKPRSVWNLPQDKFLLGFWLVITVSNVLYWVWSVYYSWMAFLPTVFCYFLLRMSVRRQSQLVGILYLLVILNVFLAVNGIVQYHTGVGFGNVAMQLNRIYGTGIFSDPNDLGMTFVMVSPLAFALAGDRDAAFLGRLGCIAAIGTIMLALFYANSRGALIGLGAALITYSFLSYRKLNAAIVTAVLVVLMVVASPSRAAQIGYGDESAQGRIRSWAEGWSLLKSHPVLGVGFGRFPEFNGLVAHNSFVETFAELGLVGAFCFAGMVYWYFKGLRGLNLTVPRTRRLRAALISSGVGVFVCEWFLSREYVVVMYVLLALGASAQSLELDGEHVAATRSSLRDFMNIGFLTLGFLVAIYFFVRTMAVWSSG
jgi:putative inorganic carbon (hco3(-)) transporter